MKTPHERLRNAAMFARSNLIQELHAYELSGDHAHIRKIPIGAECPGGDCNVHRIRNAIALLSEVVGD